MSRRVTPCSPTLLTIWDAAGASVCTRRWINWGAILGPLIIAAVLYFRGGYSIAYGWLLIPALCALGVLTTARFFYPRPQDLEFSETRLQVQGFSKAFWLYVAAAALIAAGFADFPLIAYHFQKVSVASATLIPILYAVAMGVDALAALAFGRLFLHSFE